MNLPSGRLARRSISLVRASEATHAAPVGPRLGIQVLIAFLGVIAGSSLVSTLLFVLVAPSVFKEHLDSATLGSQLPDELAQRIESAFTVASVVATLLSVTSSFAIASLASVLIARGFAVAVANLSEAASLVQAGLYDFALQATGLGPEIVGFADSFNEMAARLNAVEATRRRLLSDLAHEIRTPIATLDGYLEAFEDGIATPDATTLAMLRQQTRRMSRLVSDISSISRTEEHQLALELRDMSAADLISSCVAAARPRYEAKGVALLTRVAPRLPGIRVDRERMEQVIGNLLDNALRHTPEGGRVEVGATATADDWVSLRITDTGEGIPPEHLPHIFERFYRVDSARDRAGGGSGIGLSIVRALVAEHRGNVVVTSDGPGTGTTFIITLPPARG